jgi:4-hydroxy-2-oxoheptanedioate aldolase
MKQPNPVKAAMRAGRKSYGDNLFFPSPRVIDILGKLDFDFVFIDGEHGRQERRINDRGRERQLVSTPPPSEPDVRISRIRLSGRWFTFKRAGGPGHGLGAS